MKGQRVTFQDNGEKKLWSKEKSKGGDAKPPDTAIDVPEGFDRIETVVEECVSLGERYRKKRKTFD